MLRFTAKMVKKGTALRYIEWALGLDMSQAACVHRVEADWPIDSLRKLCGINDMEIS